MPELNLHVKAALTLLAATALTPMKNPLKRDPRDYDPNRYDVTLKKATKTILVATVISAVAIYTIPEKEFVYFMEKYVAEPVEPYRHYGRLGGLALLWIWPKMAYHAVLDLFN